MNKVIVIGSSGSGKTTFSNKLALLCNLPLYHLDAIFWKADKSHITRDEFDKKLSNIIDTNQWIIDGDYSRTYEIRFTHADTIIFLDYPLEVCLEGVQARIGKKREDMPWIETTLDEEFKNWIINWHKETHPKVLELIEKYKDNKNILVFKTRQEANLFLENYNIHRNK